MVRPKRVLSFMSEWGGSPHRRTPSSTAASPVAPASPTTKQPSTTTTYPNPSASNTALDQYDSAATTTRPRSDSRPSSRPMSMIQTYQPPMMEVSQDTLPELQRIFTFLNSHSNKLYQEGYFLKFHDTDSRGRPAPDRVWQECFAQLVGTILSLWDASELDKVGGDAEVVPTFINLTDAAIHMMPSMTLGDGKKLENILSISTAASNKYLFHFNSFNSLTQWTAGIRLAMYEHTTLQEAYTGALIAGKGKQLNNIRSILDRHHMLHEDWARVRFGAGTPWRRCWCVVTPPDEKEVAKLAKAQRKQNIYNRTPTVLKGDIKFYDTKKVTKKTRPIATVKEAYSCYAIYPQSKPLIDQSTLVKIEGKIVIHSVPESTTEGFVFVMPETHPAVSGFEIMLRFLFPVFDTFHLYGRPTKLISDVLDTRGLMFAMPPDRRYGYLEMWDVVSLIHTEGSQTWSERQWRKELKELTSKRMLSTPTRGNSRVGSRRNTVSRAGVHTRNGGVRFDEHGSVRSQPSTRQSSPSRHAEFDAATPQRTDSAPPTATFSTPRHQRSVSEANGYKQYNAETPSRLSHGRTVDDYARAPAPPQYRTLSGSPERSSADEMFSDGEQGSPVRDLPQVQVAPTEPPRNPVASPPSFAHAPSQRPPVQPYHPQGSKPNAHIDSATLHQLADVSNAPLPAGIAVAGAAAAWKSQDSLNSRRSGEYDRDGNQLLSVGGRGYPADQYQHSANSSRSGHSGSRLPTIPASPYIEQPEFVESPTVYQPTAPPVPEHAEMPATQPDGELVQRPRPGSGGSQIQRKPVPGRSPLSSREDPDNRSTKSSSHGSSRNDVVDPAALAALNLNYVDPNLVRTASMSSSVYTDDDKFSTTTPDYASTYSQESKPAVRRVPEREERPRSGMLKLIGDPSLKPKQEKEVVVGEYHYKADTKQPEITTDIPTIDFGPTYSLNPDGKRPGTSGTMTQALHDNSPSRSKENLAPSPGEQQKRQSSYLTGRTTPTMATHMRTSSASPQFSDNRSVAWQPGMAAQNSSDKQKLTPDDWVAQRAAANAANYHQASPVYSHGRSKSHTPPLLNRKPSGDWTQLQQTSEAMPARPPSRPLSRPNSRGATHLLDQRPTSLSAREQEQVARMTGTPLIDLKHNAKEPQRPSSAGLTAYIDQREKEKAKFKANRSNTAAMQAEIDRRMMAAQQRQMLEMQQQMGQQQQHMQQQQQMVMPQSNYAPSMMGVAPSVMGGMSPSIMGGGSPGFQQQAFAYSNPAQMQQMYQQQQSPQGNYFPQQAMSTYGTPSPQMQQHQQQYFQQQQQQQGYGMQGQAQQQQPVTQPYGASFDQAQAAARFAHQQGQQGQQQYRR